MLNISSPIFRVMRNLLSPSFLLVCCILAFSASAAPKRISFLESAHQVEVFDYVEITAKVEGPDAPNPFLDVAFTGSFSKSGTPNPIEVVGFCDASDGSIFRIRFMPSTPGDFSYSLKYKQTGLETNYTGRVKAMVGHRKGPIRVDPKYRWHFIWEGTGEHYFFNGTTAFWLAGWREDRTINNCIE